MKQELLKTMILISFFKCFTSCDAVKRVAEDEYLLTDNSIIVNDKKENSETLNNLLYQQPNSKIPLLNTPLRLHIYNKARPNRDSLFETWLDKNPKRRKRLIKRYSKKQVDKIKESAIGFNQWLKRTGEAPVILNEERTKKSVKRLQGYYINNGWFNVKANYDITKNDNKRAEIQYNVETNHPFIIDSITKTIKSPIVDSLYKRIQKKTLIKQNEQYRTTNFDKELERISIELRNSGIYHFNQDYITFEMDTIGTNKKVNVDINIQDRAIRNQDSIRYEPFKVYTIRDVNVITDYTFENRGKPFKDSISYNGYKIYSFC